MNKQLIQMADIDVFTEFGMNANNLGVALMNFFEYQLLKINCTKTVPIIFFMNEEDIDAPGHFYVLKTNEVHIALNLKLLNKARNNYAHVITNKERHIIFILLHEVGHYFHYLMLYNSSRTKLPFHSFCKRISKKRKHVGGEIHPECFAECFALENFELFYNIYTADN